MCFRTKIRDGLSSKLLPLFIKIEVKLC